MKSVFLSCAFGLLGLSAIGQTSGPFESGKVIEQAIKLHDEEQYNKAIELYKTIPRNDTNYVRSLYEMAYTQSLDSNFTAALASCEEGLQCEDKEYELLLMQLKGSILDDMEQPDEALKVYDAALAKYPASQPLLFNKAITLFRKEKIDEAEKIFQTLIIRNPYYASAHMKLASCAVKKGRIVPAMMSMFTYLLITPQGNQFKNVISMLDKISKATDDVTSVVAERKTSEEVFARAEQIILSKIALDKAYKLQASVDDPIVRQLQALMEVLQYEEGNPDFWMQYYVPMFKMIFSKKIFEPTVNSAFSNIELESIQRYVKKNNKEIKSAITEIVTYLNGIRSTWELDYSKRQSAPAIYHYDDGVLFAKGRLNDKGDVVGEGEFYHPNGNLKSKGKFTNEGKKDGDWKFYLENGLLSGTEQWSNGVQTGEDVIYNKWGNIISKAAIANGNFHGEKRTYYAIGHPYTVTNYKDGKKDGSYTEYYSSGSKHYEAAYANDELDGPYKSFYKSGQQEVVCSYRSGKLDGAYKSYYENGQLSFEGTYKDGKLDGEVKNYHENGKLKELRLFKEDKLQDDNKEYSDEGVLVMQVPYKDGKASGLARYFDEDGKLYSTFQFENDVLKVAKYYTKEGKEISTSTRQNKNIELSTYNADGFKTSFTVYSDAGKHQDKSIFYYPSGKTKETNDYKDGVLQGFSIGYFENGKKQYQITYSNDEKNGPAEYFYPNGQLKSKGWYSEDEPSGDWVTYNEKGKVTARYTYLNGDLTGIYEYYHPNGKLNYEEVYELGWLKALNQYDTLGKKIFTTTFKNGTGKYTSTHINGDKRFEGEYIQGELHGPLTVYFFDGSKMMEKNYEHGTLSGAYTEYHYGGQVNVKGQYKWGEADGVWKYYSKEGKLYREETYVAGQLSGKQFYYHDNGKVEMEIDYKDNEVHGSLKRYAETGELAGVIYYKHDMETSYSYLDKNGQLVPAIPLPGGTGKVVTYYSNGNKSAEMEYIDGKTNGLYKLYHPNGKTWLQTTDEFGLTTGKQTEYYNNGNLKSEYNNYCNNSDGPFKKYHENGKVKEDGTYFNGEENGTFKYYDANGKLLTERFYYYGKLLSVTPGH